MWGQPICGRRLSVERQTFGDAPTGIVPVCGRCERKLKKMQGEGAQDFESAMLVQDVENQERELLGQIQKIRRALGPEAAFRVIDNLNAVASDLFDDEFAKLNP